MYYQCVNDTFALFSDKEEAVRFFDQLKGVEVYLGEKNDCSLTVVDVLVERTGNVFTRVYCKSTISGH